MSSPLHVIIIQCEELFIMHIHNVMHIRNMQVLVAANSLLTLKVFLLLCNALSSNTFGSEPFCSLKDLGDIVYR